MTDRRHTAQRHGSDAAGVRRDFASLHLLRALAALAVMAGHARAFVLPDYELLPEPGAMTAAFYVVTGLGHQAVIVFFVLSGFLIAGSVLDRTQSGRWSWRDYAVERLSRLWVVLIPSLVLTLLWDRLGMSMASAPDGFYAGALDSLYHSGPAQPGGAVHNAGVFLANVFFLQTVAAPTYGSNGPLWSLANEFWYYVIFPLGFIALTGRTAEIWRIGCAAAALALCLLLPRAMVWLGLVWLFGALVAVWHRRAGDGRRALHPWIAAGLALLFIATLAAVRLAATPGVASDLVTGAAAALLVAALVHTDDRRMPGQPLVRALSDMSYTLYLFHFPLFAFLAVAVLGEQKLAFAPAGIAVFAGFVAAALVYSFAGYLAFERNTTWIRRRIGAALGAMKGRPLPLRREP